MKKTKRILRFKPKLIQTRKRERMENFEKKSSFFFKCRNINDILQCTRKNFLFFSLKNAKILKLQFISRLLFVFEVKLQTLVFQFSFLLHSTCIFQNTGFSDKEQIIEDFTAKKKKLHRNEDSAEAKELRLNK